MRDLGFDDYLALGPARRARRRSSEITGAPQVNIAALCLGGTLTAMLLRRTWRRAATTACARSTLLNTLLDFSEPGVLGAFADADAIGALERR